MTPLNTYNVTDASGKERAIQAKGFDITPEGHAVFKGKDDKVAHFVSDVRYIHQVEVKDEN